MSDLSEIKIQPGRAVLYGVYGLAINWLDFDGITRRQTSEIYRPDRLDEWHGRAVLQQIPWLGVRWSRFSEGSIAEQLLTALLPDAMQLSSETKPTLNYGDVEAPLLQVADWQPFGEGAAPPDMPNLPQPKLPLVQEVLPRPRSLSAEMSNEIPF